MSINECLEAIFTGIDIINEKSKDYDMFSNGEMGIANTTTSSALFVFSNKTEYWWYRW